MPVGHKIHVHLQGASIIGRATCNLTHIHTHTHTHRNTVLKVHKTVLNYQPLSFPVHPEYLEQVGGAYMAGEVGGARVPGAGGWG